MKCYKIKYRLGITYDDTLKKYIDNLVGFKQEDAPQHEIVIKNK